MVCEGLCLSHVAHLPWVLRHPTTPVSSFAASPSLIAGRAESPLPLTTDVWLSALAFCDHVALCRCRRVCRALNRYCTMREGDRVWEPAALALALSKVQGNGAYSWRERCVQAATLATAQQRWSLLATTRRVLNALADGVHEDLQTARRNLRALPAQCWEQLRAHAHSCPMGGASGVWLARTSAPAPAPAVVEASLRTLALLAEGLMLFFGPLLAQPLRAKLQQAQVLAARLTPQLWLECDRTLLQRLPALCFRDNPLLQHAAVRNVSLYERIVVDESFCAAHAAAAGSAGTACFNFIAAVHQYARALHTVQPMLTALDVEVTRVQHFCQTTPDLRI